MWAAGCAAARRGGGAPRRCPPPIPGRYGCHGNLSSPGNFYCSDPNVRTRALSVVRGSTGEKGHGSAHRREPAVRGVEGGNGNRDTSLAGKRQPVPFQKARPPSWE